MLFNNTDAVLIFKNHINIEHQTNVNAFKVVLRKLRNLDIDWYISDVDIELEKTLNFPNTNKNNVCAVEMEIRL